MGESHDKRKRYCIAAEGTSLQSFHVFIDEPPDLKIGRLYAVEARLVKQCLRPLCTEIWRAENFILSAMSSHWCYFRVGYTL